jgi:hypothetical protein
VLASKEAQMVYFTTLAKDEAVESEFKYFNRLIRQLKGVVTFHVFRIDPSASNFAELTKKYKVGSLAKGKAKLRYYPNVATDENKMQKSYEIFFNKDAKDFANIQEEVEQNYEHNVVDLVSESFNQFIVRYAKDEQKNVVYYMYRSDQKVSLDFKAVSQHSLFEEDTVFLSLMDPNPKFFQGIDVRVLPIIGVPGRPHSTDPHLCSVEVR